MAGLAKAAKAIGLKAEGVQVSREALPSQEMPALAYVNSHSTGYSLLYTYDHNHNRLSKTQAGVTTMPTTNSPAQAARRMVTTWMATARPLVWAAASPA